MKPKLSIFIFFPLFYQMEEAWEGRGGGIILIGLVISELVNTGCAFPVF